ncbi:efflux RND transporter permease subunit [Sorangium sp. So ce1014]|uniref:efflux RND transporter permease subunit n=1 Tax=Sorangium sp. So ce1014 TaxID=3133326 RepID=UPI003F638785
MSLTEACLRKPVFAWMLMAATVVFGLVAVSRIGISQFPDVDFPTITISATLEGAAPEIMEHDVVEPLEEAAVQVEGIRSITSTSRQGSASVTIELDLSRDVDVALQDVQTKISQAQRRLPLDLDPPVVSKSNPEDQPIMWVGLSGPFSPQLVADIARYRLKEKLQTVPGVGELTLGGYLERNVRIWLDAERLAARGLTVAEVTEALRRQHIELPAGRIETEGREVNVRVMGEALDLATFRKIVLRQGDLGPAARPADGAVQPAGPPSSARGTVYLEDVALVEDGFEDVRRLARVNGQPAQGLGVRKQRGSNAVEVAQGVRAALAEVEKTLPEGMEVGVNFDSTKFIEESVHEIELELAMAIALTALVCWMFLGSLSSTLNVVLAIPMSLLGTVAAIYFLGFTLNTFTLLGLSLAVGIVVDDAIMVLENIHRHAEAGKDRVRAAREGTAEITFAALAATLAVVAIFIPIIFMEGVVGRFFLQFGVTLCIAVLLSYLEAITLAPARCAQILDVSREGRSRFGRLVDRGFESLSRGYGWLLARALRFPLVVVLLGALLFAGAIVTMQRLPTEFVPSQDQGRLMVRLQTAVGSDIEETDRLFQRAEAFVGEHPAVSRVFAVVGGFGGGAVNTGILFVTMMPADERSLSQADLQGVLRKELNGYPGLRAVVQDLSQSGFTAQRGFPIEFSIRGPSFEELTKHSERMRGELAQSGLVVDLDTDYQLGMPELRILPDRARAADLGVSVEAIATTLNTLVGGGRVAKFNDNGRRIDVRARLLAEQRSRPEDLARIQVRSASGALVPLTSVVTYEELPALQAITRRDRERAISIFGNIAPGHSQGEAVARVEELGRDLPAGYRLVLGGASVTFRESMGGLLFALGLGILVAYMVLASQFNSFLHPVTVLTILPLSIAGAAFALHLSGHTLNIFSMIGILLLMGIVKKNSILLVDHAIEVRREGGRAAHDEPGRERGAGEAMDARTAMLRAGPVRLRPILMTSTATMMAAVPSALALGPGAEIRAPMAAAVIGGLLVSTALSLLVVPAFYVVADDVQGRVARLRARRAGRRAPAGPAHPAAPER